MDITWKLEDVTLDKGMEDHLFRIVQESVSNTLRHAKATSLEVLLMKRDDLLILRVTDDGVGLLSVNRKRALVWAYKICMSVRWKLAGR